MKASYVFVCIFQVHFAMNYATILCNVAVGRTLLAAHNYQVKISKESSSVTANANGNASIDNGDQTATATAAAVAAVGPTSEQYKEQMSDEIVSSMDMITSAIKALDLHISQTTVNPTEEVNSKLETNAVIIAPVLGRALGQLGSLHLNPFRYLITKNCMHGRWKYNNDNDNDNDNYNDNDNDQSVSQLFGGCDMTRYSVLHFMCI